LPALPVLLVSPASRPVPRLSEEPCCTELVLLLGLALALVVLAAPAAGGLVMAAAAVAAAAVVCAAFVGDTFPAAGAGDSADS
jgi:hypothetical protein